MAKKTPAKKPRRRLKRSIRRSLSAVLMITAIAVAAIPVPENVAAPEGGISPYAATRQDVHITIGPNGEEQTFIYDSSNKTVIKKYNNDKVNLNGKGIYTDENDMYNNPLVKQSLSISQRGNGSWDLGWQFMYYEIDNPISNEVQGVVCKYNNQYGAQKLSLDLTPATKYYTVTATELSAFFQGSDSYLLDPTATLSISYMEWKGGLASLNDAEKKFVTDANYAAGRYNDYVSEYFEEYDRLMNDNDPDNDPADKPANFTVIPNDVVTTLDQQLLYYSDFSKKLSEKGTNFNLVPVMDSTGNNGSNQIYVAQGGADAVATGLNCRKDDYGFLIIEQGCKMCAIGEKAFSGVTNVDELVLPTEIGFIGDEAFSPSFIKTISIDSVVDIGNRAFKGCTQLSKVTFNRGTEVIGVEAFEGCSKISTIELPYSVETIGYGAFANCSALTSLNLNGITQSCKVQDYAFYNCSALTNVSMADSAIQEIGEGAFAVVSGAAPISIVLPAGMDNASIGDWMFSGRSGLEYVVFPSANYGRTSPRTKIPDNMFHGCANLQYVEFPTDYRTDRDACSWAYYDPEKLFADVSTDDFYVRGPELKSNRDYAEPRTSTWEAETWVHDYVPYVFQNTNGEDCYEVAINGYRYQVRSVDGTSNNGIITSCVLVDGNSTGDLVIPAKVGKYNIVSIATECFGREPYSEEAIEVRDSIKTITIEDNSINEIQDGVFKNLPKLTEVTIGNSVNSIGDSAFEGCSLLKNVTFHTPLNGDYEGFTIGTDAFKTRSDELTFHGDIVAGYAPFDWAMDPDNIIDLDKEPQSEGVRVCYKSPYYLMVMYNPITEMVTLLDYPKAAQIDSILADIYKDALDRYKVKTYDEYRVAYLYDVYLNSNYDELRTDFAQAWRGAADDDAKEALYHSDIYGPWVNADFCEHWTEWENGTPGNNTSSGSTTGTGGGDTVIDTLSDWLFEPITAYAADNPKPYYDVYEYDVIKNAAANDPYRPSNPDEDYLRYAVENIVVPEGVESIDVYGYVNNLTSDGEIYNGTWRNTANYRTYLALGWDPEVRNMYTRSQGEDENETLEIVPGLFSGYYVDFNGDSDFEKFKRGNDTIKTVTMTSVKYLPDYAFDSCEQLWNVSLGEECADIGTAPFRGCDALSSVIGNNYYEADNGIIYSKNTDGSLTIEECFASRGKPGIVGQASVSLANDPKLGQVSAIKPGAFEDCDVITDVDFGNNNTLGLKEIPKDCFKNCDDLQRVVLPVTVDDVGSGAFVGSNRLSDLTIYGKEVKISGTAFNDDAEKAVTRVRTYEDSAVVRYVKEYGTDYKLQLTDIPLGEQWQVTFLGPDYTVIEDLKDIDGNALDNPQYVEDGGRPIEPQDPESTVDWTFDKWVGMNNVKMGDRITEDTIFYAQGYSNNGMVNGQYIVEFYDSIDGTKIGPTQYIDPGKDAVAPAYPVHSGYTFDKWSEEPTNIQSNKAILALYKANNGLGTVSGGSTNTSNGSTNTSNGSTNSSNNTTNTSKNTTSNSSNTSSSSSTSTSSTTSGSDTARSLHRVTVINGSGGGSYATGATVVIAANEPAAGMRFKEWTTESSGVTFNQITATATQFTMPDNDVLIIANFEGGTATPAVTPTSTTGGTGGGTTDGGNTRVDITKPGISNKDLATANVNGSTDNFIIKITETDEATRAVADALTNKYGSLDNILYYAMDISLWDATGTYKLTGDQLAGISVDITIPIPDALVAYGGNNMAGAVINGNQLENLNENFTTINGVPCIRFTATHFSPYTVYVDTGNLTEGMLDATPKTGDPIHPKWFLSIGLACLSIVLFMKKDKAAKVKTA